MIEIRHTVTGDKRNAPIWQVATVIVVLMTLAAGAFIAGSKNPAKTSLLQNDFGTDGGSAGVSQETVQSNDNNVENEGASLPQTQYIQLNNLNGYGSTSVERALFASGLRYFTRYTNGDPSLSARLNDGCIVVDQSPPAGSVIPEGTQVTILADCPLTGQ